MLRHWLDTLDLNLREVIEGACLAIIFRIAGTVLAFIVSVLIARALGAQGTGIISLASICVVVGTVVGRFGLDLPLLQFIASGVATQNQARVDGAYRSGMRAALVASGSTTVVIFAAAPAISNYIFHEPSLTMTLRILSISVFPLCLVNLHAEALKGLKLSGQATFVQITVQPLLVVILLGGMFPFVTHPETLAALQTICAFVALWLAVRLWNRRRPRQLNALGNFTRKDLLTTSYPLFLAAIMGLIMSSTDTVILGIYRETNDVGVYSAAASAVLTINFILVAVNTIAGPKFAGLYSQKKIAELSRLARQATSLMIGLALPVFIFLFFWPELILHIFGTEFVIGSTALPILAAGQFINVATGSVGYLLVMTGHEKVFRNIIVLSALVNLSLNVLLVPSYGLVGASTATAVSLSLMNLVCMVMVRVELGFWTFPLISLRSAKQNSRVNRLELDSF